MRFQRRRAYRTLTEEEIERRRPLWIELSDLYLDTELETSDHGRMSDAIVASGFTLEEVERILRCELGPVLGMNLLSVAGAWSGFDPDRLVEAVLDRQRSWRRHLPSFTAFRMIQDHWKPVRARVARKRSG